MKEEGIVIKIGKDTATIEIPPRKECTKCCSCGASGPRRTVVSGDKAKGLRVGDRVEIDIETGSMMRVYILLYALPLAAFVMAALILHAVFRSPAASFAGAIISTIITYMLVGFYIRRNPGFSPDVCVKRIAELDNQ
jgi:positive regulator of sigma E activity